MTATVRPEAIRVVLEGLAATTALGEVLAGSLAPGDVVLLSGELGAGKTTLTRALVGALGADVAVTSPTFTLCHQYPTNPPITHVDCWRLERAEEIVDLGLEEVLDGGGVLLIEWGERALFAFGTDALFVLLESEPDAPGTRIATLCGLGGRMAAALGALARRISAAGLSAEAIGPVTIA